MANVRVPILDNADELTLAVQAKAVAAAAGDATSKANAAKAASLQRVGGGLHGYTATTVTGATKTVTLADGNIQQLTLQASTTLTLTGATNGAGCTLRLHLVQDGTGGRVVTWPASVKWPSGAAPNLSTGANARDVVVLETFDGGTTWFGAVDGLDFRAASAQAAFYTYTSSTAVFPNPERGFFNYTETHYTSGGSGYVPLSSTALASARTASNQSLVFRYFVMEKFLTQDTIDTAWLNLVAADLAAIRDGGCKGVLRFVYSTSGNMTPPYGADPPVARVLSHIAQIAAVVNNYADVVHAVQAGFIGMWGEWYYTDNFGDTGTVNTTQKNNRVSVISALLSNLNSAIFVQLRYVGLFKWASDAGLNMARLGHHNDAIGAPYADYGTYTTFTDVSEGATRALLATRAATGVPVGGESAVGNSPATDYPQISGDFATYRYSYLNPIYHPDVLNSWSSVQKEDATRKLGYRLRLTTATLPSTAAAGAAMNVTFALVNDGWGAVLSARPLQVVFVNGGTVVTRTLAADVRTCGPGGTLTVNETVTAPSAGSWTVHARCPDANSGLANTPAFSIRFANSTGWDSASGRNAFGHTVTVS